MNVPGMHRNDVKLREISIAAYASGNLSLPHCRTAALPH